ncbi:MAG: zinc-ribbon domain-containing protein [Bacteroidetes bacterium]|nr:zinc-ribbon domain-containing protein [Bacteroidota bacterium]
MFFIFGWNHTKITEYGAVQEEKCQNCHNTDIWQLKKISRYFTLFFIPVFPHDSENLYHCPICNYGLKLEHEEFEDYKAIAEVNTNCLDKKITEEERSNRLDEIHRKMQQRNESRNSKNRQDSKKWETLAAEKSDAELQTILAQKSEQYNPAFIIAAKTELDKRKS